MEKRFAYPTQIAAHHSFVKRKQGYLWYLQREIEEKQLQITRTTRALETFTTQTLQPTLRQQEE